jgi:hypothetical protein
MELPASWLIFEPLHVAAKALAYPTGSTKRPSVEAGLIILRYNLIKTFLGLYFSSAFTDYSHWPVPFEKELMKLIIFVYF